MKKIVIALGANIGDKQSTFQKAIALLGQRVGKVLSQSEFLETAPLTLPDGTGLGQDNYLNAAVLIKTKFSPEEVLQTILAIECELGRDRKLETKKWSPRVLDLDLLLYEQEIIELENLQVPHPRLHERNFILHSIDFLYPEWVHPVFHKTSKQLLHDL